MGCAGPCPGQRHGPWLLLPQGSRSSQRDEPYTERTLASAGSMCCPLEAVREAPGGGHEGVWRTHWARLVRRAVWKGWACRWPRELVFWGLAFMSLLQPCTLRKLVFPLGHLVSPSYNTGSWPRLRHQSSLNTRPSYTCKEFFFFVRCGKEQQIPGLIWRGWDPGQHNG